jgi:uncharacterized protein (DUF1330 family)
VRRWYQSDDYQALVALRAGSAEVAAIVVDGYGDDAPEPLE